MRVHIAGQRRFAADVLAAIRAAGHEVTGVTAPIAHHRDPARDDLLHTAAAAAGIPVTHWVSPKLIAPGTDVLIAAHSHDFIGNLTRARVELAVGYHPSLLPLHRGRDAVRWTIRDRDRVAGGTVYHLTSRVDGGPIAEQDWCLVRPGETAETLWRERLAPMGVALLTRFLERAERGTVHWIPQEEACATWEPALDPPRLHRPELPALPAPGPGRYRYTADPAADPSAGRSGERADTRVSSR